jgi:hypothetical protein
MKDLRNIESYALITINKKGVHYCISLKPTPPGFKIKWVQCIVPNPVPIPSMEAWEHWCEHQMHMSDSYKVILLK